MALIIGTTGSDLLIGTLDNDYIQANLGGNDTIDGGDGDDSIEFGSGNNLVFGGNGNDYISVSGYVSDGNDIVFGGAGNDTLIAGGNDTLSGGAGFNDFVLSSYILVALGPDSSAPRFDVLKGIATITDFKEFNSELNTVDLVERDFLVMSKYAYGLSSDVGLGLSNPGDFEVVASDTDAAFSDALITFSRSTGSLFYNQNGAVEGLGAGSQLATIVGVSDLTSDSFRIIW
jgi:Ca2+-binding RTX toxin-like protein